jgi:hypothetical protein
MPADWVRDDPRFAELRPVTCARCGARALVAKFSPQHTSVQWTLDATATCDEFGALAAAGQHTALAEGCASMRAAIVAAVRSGHLAVTNPASAASDPPPASDLASM